MAATLAWSEKCGLFCAGLRYFLFSRRWPFHNLLTLPFTHPLCTEQSRSIFRGDVKVEK